uniref:ATP-dependent transporter ycf16 n=2 Tax=Pinguiococcus pyrenoidosus TaxID=172671 RepID=A0A7R9U7Y8_9STRA
MESVARLPPTPRAVPCSAVSSPLSLLPGVVSVCARRRMDAPKLGAPSKAADVEGATQVGRHFWKLAALLFGVEVLSGATLVVVGVTIGLDGLYPYSFRESVLDVEVFLFVVGLLSFLLGTPRDFLSADEVLLDSNAKYLRTCGFHALLVAFCFVKAALFRWTWASSPVIAAATACLGYALILSFSAALVVRLARDTCEEERRDQSVLYHRLLGEDEEAGAGEDEQKKELGALEILKTLKPYFWPRSIRGRIFVMLTWLCVGSSKVCNVVAPIFLSNAANHVNDGDTGPAVRQIAIFGALLFLGKTFKEGQSLAYLRVAQAAFVDLAEDTFNHVHSLSLGWHLKKKLGEVVRVTDRGISACDTLMRYGVLYLGPAILETLAVCILFLTYFNYWPLAVLCFVSVLVYAIITVKLTLWRKQFRSRMNKADNEWHDKLTDSLVNYETVKYFTNERYEVQRFLNAVYNYQAFNVEVLASLSALNVTQQLILNSCLIGALVLSAIAIQDGTMDIGNFVAVNTWVLNLFTPLNFLGTVYNAIVTAWVDLKNLSQLFAEEPDIFDSPHAKALPKMPFDPAHPGLGLSFENVTFVYKENDRGIRNITFRVAAGTTTAIVGTTGAGKTTISRLLFRFYDPSSGSIRLDGEDIRNVTQKSLRDEIGVVPQDTVLFNDTIRHNVMYGKLDATDEEIEAAAEGAQILEFIRNLPEGWNTLVGERGLKLSGGEKQRVAIARCLLKNPPVVLLDEATSALDSRTEQSVQSALNSLGKNRTCLVIAHRLGTIQHADQIVVLDQGSIVEQGTHEDLVARRGEYFAMWQAQQLKPAEESKAGGGSSSNLVDMDLS